jgi:hypothetical protein
MSETQTPIQTPPPVVQTPPVTPAVTPQDPVPPPDDLLIYKIMSRKEKTKKIKTQLEKSLSNKNSPKYKKCSPKKIPMTVKLIPELELCIDKPNKNL